MPPAHIQGQLTAVHDNLLKCSVNTRARVAVQNFFYNVDDLIEPAAKRALAITGHGHGAHEPAVAGGVARTGDTEHALAHIDDVFPGLGARFERGLGGRAGHQRVATLNTGLNGFGRVYPLLVVLFGLVTHASSPFMCEVGSAFMAASSTARAASTRFTPSGMFCSCLCSSSRGLMSISGRGGQPGR